MAITQPWTPPSMEGEGKVTRWRTPGGTGVHNFVSKFKFKTYFVG